MAELDTAANKAIVASFFATFSSGNVPAIIAAMDEEGTWWVSGKLEGFSGTYTAAALGPLLEGAKALYKGGALRITPTAMMAEGDKVAVEAQGFAELLDGRVYDPHYHFLVTVRGGKIAEVREYMDTQHAKDIFFGG
jgi:ketosteroid isomerase-like protein